MAEDTLIASAGVLHEPDIPPAKKLEWIDGLRRAQVVEPLLELGHQHWPEEELHQAIGVALARCSTLEDFWTLADQESPTRPAGGATDAEINPVPQGWGWPYAPPETEHGRHLCSQLALRLSRDLSEARMEGRSPAAPVPCLRPRQGMGAEPRLGLGAGQRDCHWTARHPQGNLNAGGKSTLVQMGKTVRGFPRAKHPYRDSCREFSSRPAAYSLDHHQSGWPG